MRRKESKMQDMRGLGRGRMPGPYNIDPRPNSAPAGYADIRGGQGHPGMNQGVDAMVMNGMMPYAGMHPGMYPGVYHQGLNLSPHPSVPPQYAPHEYMPEYPHGMGGPRNAVTHQSHQPRPPPLSTTSSSSSKSRSKPVPSAIQAAIDEAIQKSTGNGGNPKGPLSRSDSSPVTLTKDNSDGWGDGIDTCICTTNCKCRKGERAVKWYEGMAKIGGEEVPVRAKLNTRFVLKDDIGKDCGDHSGCKKASSSKSCSSSSSDTESSKPKKCKRKSRRKAKKAGKADTLDDLQAELDMMKRAAAMKQGGPYESTRFARYGPGNEEGYDPKMTNRMMEMRDPYGMGRVGGMNATGKLQGMYDPLTTRNLRQPRVPPKPGMRIRRENYGFEGDRGNFGRASPSNPYAQPSTMRGKGRKSNPMPPRRTPRLGLLREPESDSEPSTSTRRRGMGDVRPGKSRAFELDDLDISLDPRRQSVMRDFCSDGDEEPTMYHLPSKSCIVSVFGLRLAETSLVRGDGEKNSGTSPWSKLSRISPPGRKGGVRKGRSEGKQACAETDDDEDC